MPSQLLPRRMMRPYGARREAQAGRTPPSRAKDTPLGADARDPERVDASGSLRERRPPRVAPVDRSRGCFWSPGSPVWKGNTDEKPGARPLMIHCSGIRITHTISSGPDRRAACASKLRDGMDRLLDRVVGPHGWAQPVLRSSSRRIRRKVFASNGWVALARCSRRTSLIIVW